METIRLPPYSSIGVVENEIQVTMPRRNPDDGLWYNVVRHVSRYDDGSIYIHSQVIAGKSDPDLLVKPHDSTTAFLQFYHVASNIVQPLWIAATWANPKTILDAFNAGGSIAQSIEAWIGIVGNPGIIPDEDRPAYAEFPDHLEPWKIWQGNPLDYPPNTFVRLIDSNGSVVINQTDENRNIVARHYTENGQFKVDYFNPDGSLNSRSTMQSDNTLERAFFDLTGAVTNTQTFANDGFLTKEIYNNPMGGRFERHYTGTEERLFSSASYDAIGNLVSRSEYAPSGHMTLSEFRGPDGVRTVTMFDAAGSGRITNRDTYAPDGSITNSSTFHANGMMKSISALAPDGTRTIEERSENGIQTYWEMTSPSGVKASRAFNEATHEVTVTNVLANGTKSVSIAVEGDNGLLTQKSHANYDESGLLLSETLFSGGSISSHWMKTDYGSTTSSYLAGQVRLIENKNGSGGFIDRTSISLDGTKLIENFFANGIAVREKISLDAQGHTSQLLRLTETGAIAYSEKSQAEGTLKEYFDTDGALVYKTVTNIQDGATHLATYDQFRDVIIHDIADGNTRSQTRDYGGHEIQLDMVLGSPNSLAKLADVMSREVEFVDQMDGMIDGRLQLPQGGWMSIDLGAPDLVAHINQIAADYALALTGENTNSQGDLQQMLLEGLHSNLNLMLQAQLGTQYQPPSSPYYQ